MKKDFNIKEMLISLLIKIIVLGGLYFLSQYFQFSVSLTAAILLSVFLGMIVITSYKNFKTPQKALFVGLFIASAILSLLFAYDYFISDIRITVFHILIVLFIPIGIGNYLVKKEKEKT